MTVRMIRARVYCAQCDRYWPWFACSEDRAVDLVCAARDKHRDRCPKRTAP